MKRFQTRVPGSILKVRLDHFLLEWLPQKVMKPVSRSTLRALLMTGSVYVNRHRVKGAATPLYSGAVIEVYYDEDRLFKNRPVSRVAEKLETARIVFEDEWIIVINKPAGVPTQPTIDPLRPNLFGMTKDLLATRDQAADPYLGLHHRLDRDTSGLVLFTKREEANKGVSELFSEHRIQKTYQCVTWRSPGAPVLAPQERFTVDDFIGRVEESKGKGRFGAVSSGGSRAVTDFRVIEGFREAYWLEALPRTGRTHQIRVHTSGRGLPILGDELYFPEGVSLLQNAPRLMLHALALEFLHPVTQAEVRVEASLPLEFVAYLGRIK